MHGTTANMSGLNFLQKLEEFLTLNFFFNYNPINLLN